jgi:phosphoserine phosphatase RsbU/P
MGTVVTDSEGNTFAARGSVRCATQLKFSLNDLTADERRTLESDLNLAARIQQAQLPTRDFASAGFEIRFHYEPAGLLSGDCCDLFESRDGLLFLLGDVSGKGIASSLLVGHLRAIFRSLADLPLDTMVKAANRIFSQSALDGQFATLVAGHITRNGSVEFISAGHPPFLHVSHNGVRFHGSTELPLGMFTDAPVTTHRFFLDDEESLLIFTDGLTETRNPAGEHYDINRLLNLAVRHRRMAPSELVAQCLSELVDFTAGAKHTDDLTLLVIRRWPVPPAAVKTVTG